MPFSNYGKGKVYDHSTARASWTMPTTVYVALYTSDPTASDAGTEVSGGSYSRKALTMGAGTNGAGTNSSTVSFGTATASWGTVTHFGIRDASTAGNLIFYGPLTVSKTVNSGDTFDFLTGDISITIA